MINMNKIPLYCVPREKCADLLKACESEPEMSIAESGFICGLIKSIHPKKILEVGIAGGGTTAIILKCLQMLNFYDTEVLSIDNSINFYRDESKRAGFLGELAKKEIPLDKCNHSFLLGKVACSYGERLRDADFVLLDTTHNMPGELLDFITLLPYLKDSAVVVFHDLAMSNSHDVEEWKYCYATTVLFSAIKGEKYINSLLDGYSFANIGAVVISEETRKNIGDVFLALMINWNKNFIPSSDELAMYRASIEMNYSSFFLELFDTAVKFNQYEMKEV